MWNLGVVLFDEKQRENVKPLYQAEQVEAKPLVFESHILMPPQLFTSLFGRSWKRRPYVRHVREAIVGGVQHPHPTQLSGFFQFWLMYTLQSGINAVPSVQLPGLVIGGYDPRPFASCTDSSAPVMAYVPLIVCPTGRYVPVPDSNTT
jgi:hypothetical protein